MAKKFLREKAVKPDSESNDGQTGRKGRKYLTKKTGLYIGFFLVLLAALAASILFYFKYQEAIRASNELVGGENEVKELVEKVGKLAELPRGEVPTIATVSDISALSGQEFFKNGQNGDKVLIYQGAQTAYLYRPGSGKIVNIGPVSANEESIEGVASQGAQLDASPTPAAPARVLLLNGTTTTGLTRVAETDLEDNSIENIEVVDRDNAQSNGYEEVVVVDVSGEHGSEAGAIATVLAGQAVKQMPTGENTPDGVDIVVILGSSYAN